jgi:hypothetical protein
MHQAVHRLAALRSPSMLCAALGIVGGLLLGWVLSRSGAWLTPVPWAIYFVGLLTLIATISLLDVRRTALAPEPWTLRPEDVLGTDRSATSTEAAEGATEAAPAGVADEQPAIGSDEVEPSHVLPVEFGEWTALLRYDEDEPLSLPARAEHQAAAPEPTNATDGAEAPVDEEPEPAAVEAEPLKDVTAVALSADGAAAGAHDEAVEPEAAPNEPTTSEHGGGEVEHGND